jgi:hypothetical protein
MILTMLFDLFHDEYGSKWYRSPLLDACTSLKLMRISKRVRPIDYHLVHAHFHVFHKILYTRASLVLFLQEPTMERTAEEGVEECGCDSHESERRQSQQFPSRALSCASLSREIETSILLDWMTPFLLINERKRMEKGGRKSVGYSFICSFARKRAPPGIFLDERWLWELREIN